VIHADNNASDRAIWHGRAWCLVPKPVAG
jgi:hypothetical protein